MNDHHYDSKLLQSNSHLQSTHPSIEQHKDLSLRKRMHALLAENFELKENLARVEQQLKASQEQRRELREQLKMLLEEMASNDSILQRLKGSELEQRTLNVRLEDQLAALQEQLSYEREVITQLIEHNSNLELQNQLITDIKQKYMQDHAKLKTENDVITAHNTALTKENQLLTTEIDKLLFQLAQLQQQLQTRRNDLQQYQRFVMDKLSSANKSFHDPCVQKLQSLQEKYWKYKQKSCSYKQQRDHLLSQLQTLSLQMDSATLRKYYE